jgi:hypothetical protein
VTATRPARATAADAELSIVIDSDGVSHTLFPNLLTGQDTRAIREQTGMSLRRLIEYAQDDPDIDVLAALVWIARCQAGETVDLAHVAAQINYQTKFDINQAASAVPGDHPSS